MVHIRRAKEEDLIAILDIYNQGIRDRIATLETEEKDLKYMSDWFLQRSDKYAVLTAAIEHEVAGWASLNPYSHRCAYRGVAGLSLKGREGLRLIFVNIQPRNQPLRGGFIAGMGFYSQ
ncbi:GNAT family N-acetyltransferase [Bacillus atrophaeus]|uniref:GNAT family N-acetyltransferase n=1 Tax=Bacillus atrophaeus TaxID=1452 RepID=UPI001C6260F9|nr:GCN5 family acetyltransferase [Bacillus atrophaeus]MCY8920607.1 GCN5 family acetyltransferase [Bacillus atrophaeus]MED4803484.1 GCN5 family acetyltransferase [Bacillus atrophaeus]MED4814876.1 GCN5 family acetyltransferase [Bacillus atrophaeus]MED4824336.1 GCN5 family acetyltransferase [Bacillus atrophaeus]MED4843504.1 GCN5 family acetyltransferase [Bacillus atrophaeus]